MMSDSSANVLPGGQVGWLLVTGAPRSGTSLLRALLHEHPGIGLLQEYGLTNLVRLIDAIVARPAAAQEDWESPGDPGDDRFNAVCALYRDRPARTAVTRGGGDPGPENFTHVAAGLFGGMFPDKALAFVGDKMPITEDWEDIPLLFARLPGLRIVAVVRNPLDTVRSSLVRREATRRGRDTWPIQTVQEAVAQWLTGWREVVSLCRRHPQVVHIVKYEDLCERPQASVDGLTEWLGLPPHCVGTPIAALPADLALHTDAEQALMQRLVSPVSEAWPALDAQTLVTRFAEYVPPYVLGETLRLGTEEATPYLLSGFSFREDWGRWTDGPQAVLSIPHGETRGTLLVEIRIVQAFRSPGETCDVVVRCGWGEPRLFALDTDPARIAFLTQAEEAETAGTLAVELVLVHPKQPGEGPADSRAIGILVETVRVTRLPDARRP